MSNPFSDSSQSLFETRTAAQTHATFFDVSNRTQIEVTGSDRARFLHSFTSNDIKGLKAGQGCEAFLTSLKGKVVAHFFVFCGENSFWLDGTPGQADTITAHLRKYVLIDDVQINPCGDTRGELFVTGPLSAHLLQIEDALKWGGHLHRESETRSVDFRRVDLFGGPGFLMSMPASQLDEVKRGLKAVGVAEGSPQLFEAMRIEAGYPLYGLDITDDNLAQEVARTKQCISFNKGCYLGQETIARLDAIGHTNRELRRLEFETTIVPPAGTMLYDAAGDNEVGSVTSAASAIGKSVNGPAGSVVAMGMMKRAACQPGTPIGFKFENQTISGRVLNPVTENSH